MNDLLRDYWEWFLFDTLVWTGALIALVMILRRPVARLFGAGAAYALWFLPLARLVLPPFTLPAWMRPANEVVEPAEPAFVFGQDAIALPVAEPGMSGPTFVASAEVPFDYLALALLLWLGGALVFLARRFHLYFALRRELLAHARPVGDVGSIRLIETSAISGPMAFGVLDRVIALPHEFMANRDTRQRDLAIEHELAHHRGGDLLANMAVQPLFALHWFNPLGWLGWTALRRDQEAFCDARVVASRPREERAAYAGIIADFARHSTHAPRPALAAPMACPVLGDKSIIHRLRSLSMSDISPRRRLTGRAAIAAAFLAVPLTASIAYAESVNTGDTAMSVAPVPPAPPKPPLADLPPNPPAPPSPPVPEAGEWELEEAEREMELAEREIERAAEEVERSRRELQEVRRELGAGSELRRDLSRAVAQTEKEARAARFEAFAVAEHARAYAPRVVMACRNSDQMITTEEDSDGRVTMYVCEANADKLALNALRSARSAIAIERNLTDAQRAEALRSIDEEIAELES